MKVLYREMESAYKDSQTIPQCEQYKDSADTIAALKQQIEAYTCQHAPFSARSPAWSMMDYWKQMAESPHADVLAVRFSLEAGVFLLTKFSQFLGIKLYSMLPNSMPEERTVSLFTRMNTNDRASQKADSVIAMTKVRQFYRRLDRLEQQQVTVFSHFRGPSIHDQCV